VESSESIYIKFRLEIPASEEEDRIYTNLACAVYWEGYNV
jgi:hypothetical protein